jgi:hypothetical protein
MGMSVRIPSRKVYDGARLQSMSVECQTGPLLLAANAQPFTCCDPPAGAGRSYVFRARLAAAAAADN